MGLWLKKEDGTLVEVSGGGGDGTFDGEHVLTGDPSDPAVVELVDEGQLLYDGVEGDGSGGGGIEEAPSDGKQYARKDEAWSEVVAVADAVNEDQFAIAEWNGSIPSKANTNPATDWTALPTADPNGWVASGGIVPPAGWYWLSASYVVPSGVPQRVIMYLNGTGESRTNDVGATSNIAGTASKLVYADGTAAWGYADGTAAWGGVGIWHDGATALDFKLTVRMARVGGSSGGGGDAGPHDHDEYLPLTGGRLTSTLWSDGQFIATENGGQNSPRFQIGEAAGLGMYGSSGSQWLRLTTDDVWRLQVSASGVIVTGNLQVEGDSTAKRNLVAEGSVKFAKVVSGAEGTISTNRPNLYANSNGWLFKTSWTPSRMAFAPSKLTRDADVLERAETATLPPEPETDDDGNQTNTAEVEAHDTVELFDVVTALLAKVKELSARIEELEGA
jgi:hypothetical protein